MTPHPMLQMLAEQANLESGMDPAEAKEAALKYARRFAAQAAGYPVRADPTAENWKPLASPINRRLHVVANEGKEQ